MSYGTTVFQYQIDRHCASKSIEFFLVPSIFATMSNSPCTIVDSQVSCDPGNAVFFNNPYPVYDEMRAIGPCFYWQEYEIWCFARYDLVSAILRDRRFGRQISDVNHLELAADHVKPFYAFEVYSILELEPPDHTRLRRLINKSFISRKIDSFRPVIHALAHSLIDELEGNGQVNLLSEFAEIIPVQIIAKLLGVDTEHSAQLLRWSHDMVAMYQHNRSREIEEKAVVATTEFSAFIGKILDQRRADPRDDLISHLVQEQKNGEDISDEELITTCILLLNAGHEATVHAIGNGVKTLLENVDNPAALFKEASVEKSAAICEEVMRYDPPLHKFTRYVLEDLEIGGRKFKRGDVVGLMLGAANRDPEKFENPNQLDYNRPRLAASNMAFGAGIHFCVGAPLARLEMQIAVPILFERLAGLYLPATPIYADRYHFHGLEELKICW